MDIGDIKGGCMVSWGLLGTRWDLSLIISEDKCKDINCVWNEFQDPRNKVYWI